jgi:hypothetical protein
MSYSRKRHYSYIPTTGAKATLTVKKDYRYNSLEEFLTYIYAEAAPYWGHSHASRSDNNKFFGGITFEQAQEKVRLGCPKTSEKMREMYNDIHASYSKIFKPEYQFADAGQFFDVATFLEGAPEYWLSEEITETESKGSKGVVRIFANVASSAMRTSEEYLKRGANIAQAVEMLELSGYSTEIIVCAGNACNGQEHDCYVTIKEADQMLDFDKLAFVVGHIAFYRRLYFRWLERLPEAARTALNVTASGGYGSIVDCPVEPGISLTHESYAMTQSQWKNILSEYITFEEAA